MLRKKQDVNAKMRTASETHDAMSADVALNASRRATARLPSASIGSGATGEEVRESVTRKQESEPELLRTRRHDCISA